MVWKSFKPAVTVHLRCVYARREAKVPQVAQNRPTTQ